MGQASTLLGHWGNWTGGPLCDSRRDDPKTLGRFKESEVSDLEEHLSSVLPIHVV